MNFLKDKKIAEENEKRAQEVEDVLTKIKEAKNEEDLDAKVMKFKKNEKQIEEEPVEESDDKVISIAPKKRRAFRYLAVAAALPILFYAYWIPMETDFIDTGKIQMADFNPIFFMAGLFADIIHTSKPS